MLSVKKRRRSSVSGFTLVELMTSAAIGAVIVAGALSLWRFGSRQWFAESVSVDLRRKLGIACEHLKRDLRATSADEVFFYPPDRWDFEAISFPQAVDDDDVIEVDGDGRILWDHTVVYHALRTDPTQLRRTVFTQRDNALTDLERQEQLEYVARNGVGNGTYEGASARTKTLFSNLFDIDIRPNTSAYDSYAENRHLERNAQFGSIVLTPGTHYLAFQVTGRDEASSGYRVALDALSLGRSGSRFQAEDLFGSAVGIGGTLTVQDMSEGGGWGGNRQLVFNASGPGSLLVLILQNDAWRESIFAGEGAILEGTSASFDDSIAPGRFCIELAGNGETWSAAGQTETTPSEVALDENYEEDAVRVVVEGGRTGSGGHIEVSGALCRLWFRAHPTEDHLKIDEAWVALRSAGPDAASGTMTRVTFGSAAGLEGVGVVHGGNGVLIDAGAVAPSDWIPFALHPTNDYVVTFAVAGGEGNGVPCLWEEPGSVQAYVLPDGGASASAAAWSTEATLRPEEAVVALDRIEVSHPAWGTYTSSVFDTHDPEPSYQHVVWEEDLRGGSVQIRVRAGHEPDLSDASAWDSAPVFTGGGGSHSLPPGLDGRYLQFQAELAAAAGYFLTPRVYGVTIQWAPEVAGCEVVADVTGDPAGAKFEVYVDGKQPTKAVTVDLELFEDFMGHRYRERACTEVEPRNTGR